MQLTGFFVEYLIIGSTALLWLLPLLIASDIPIPEDKALIALLTPSLYVLGMIVDVAGHFLTHRHRTKILSKAKAKYLKRYGVKKLEHATIDAELYTLSPEVGKVAAARRSRARVARGTLTNTIIIVPTWIVIAWPILSWGEVLLYAEAGCLAILALWSIWARWQRFVYRFEIKALSMKP